MPKLHDETVSTLRTLRRIVLVTTEHAAEYFEQIAAEHVQQAARIAELEGDLSTKRDEADELLAQLVTAKEQLAAADAERDAVRKALAWIATLSFFRIRTNTLLWDEQSDSFGIDDPNHVDHDGTPEGIQNALLTAHRESEER